MPTLTDANPPVWVIGDDNAVQIGDFLKSQGHIVASTAWKRGSAYHEPTLCYLASDLKMWLDQLALPARPSRVIVAAIDTADDTLQGCVDATIDGLEALGFKSTDISFVLTTAPTGHTANLIRAEAKRRFVKVYEPIQDLEAFEREYYQVSGPPPQTQAPPEKMQVRTPIFTVRRVALAALVLGGIGYGGYRLKRRGK